MPLNLSPFGKPGSSILGAPAIDASTWQYQPTSTSHDPNPPLTLEAGGADVTVALNGQASTGATGTLIPASSVAASGQPATGSSGTAVPSVSVALAGQSSTDGTGTATPSISGGDVTVALTGEGSTSATGAASPDTSIAASGQHSTGEPGAVASDRTIALAGESSTDETGTAAGAASITLEGAAAEGATGIVTPIAPPPPRPPELRIGGGYDYGRDVVLPSRDVTVALAGAASRSGTGAMRARVVVFTKHTPSPFKVATGKKAPAPVNDDDEMQMILDVLEVLEYAR